MATKQFGYRVSVSVSSVADQLRFGCFVQRVRKASHIELWAMPGRFRDELLHVAFQLGRDKIDGKASALSRSHEGLAHIFLASRRFTGTRVLGVKVPRWRYLQPAPEARGQH
jgi:hypothetical protein